jgi:hypothetical protein
MFTETIQRFVKRSALAVALLALFAASLAPIPFFNAVVKASASGDCPDNCQEQLTEARAATAQYHKESKALADGFFSTFECVEVPGLGAMGVHYVNPARMMDISVNASEPEALLYFRQPDNTMRLVGLEYVAPALSNGAPWFGGENTPPPVVDNPAPVLFGRTFDGPMAGHTPGQPWHYDLHVWAWRDNPLGLFFPFNSKLSCQ